MNTQGLARVGRLTHFRKGVLTVGAGVVLGLSSFAAGATETTFIGYTNGCFSLSCPPPSTSALQTATIGGLTYTNSTFDVTTVGGLAFIADVVALPNVDNFGSFSLTGSPLSYTGHTFQLRVTFTAPPGMVPTNDIFTADLTGAVVSDNIGSVSIDFDNSAHHFTFEKGNVDFFINDVDLTPGGSIPVSARADANVSAVPEPATLALLGIGLAGIRGLRRRTLD